MRYLINLDLLTANVLPPAACLLLLPAPCSLPPGYCQLPASCQPAYCQPANCQLPTANCRPLRERAPFRLRNPDPEDRRGDECRGANEQRLPESARVSEGSDQVRRRSAREAADVIGKALRGRANSRRIDLRRHRAEAAEVPSRCERDARPEHEQERRVPHGDIHAE